MSKLQILWIDDKWKELESIKDVWELPKNNFEVTPCTNAVEGMGIFESRLDEWAGVVLDAKVLYDKDSKLDSLRGLTYSLNKIKELQAKRYVPYYILTGQPGTNSSSSFAEEHEGYYYEKGTKDEAKLIQDIKENAKKLENIQIMQKHSVVFDYWSESRHELLRIIKILESEDWQNNSVLNDIRKIMTDVMVRLNKCGLCTVEHDGANLGECSRMIGASYMEDLIPVYIQRSIHSCVAVTNPGSHRTQTDTDVKNNNAPYLLRSLIYETLNILYWCKNLPSDSDKEKTIKLIKTLEKEETKSKGKEDEIKGKYEGKIFTPQKDKNGIWHCDDCYVNIKYWVDGNKMMLENVQTNTQQSEKNPYPYFAKYKKIEK